MEEDQEDRLFKPLANPSLHSEEVKSPNPNFKNGKVLPKIIRSRFLKEAVPCVPLQEIDPYYRNQQTFVAIGRWGTLHRFSCKPRNYGILEPSNVFRKLAIYLHTNWIFSSFIVATVLLNIVSLVTTQSYEISNSIKYSEGNWNQFVSAMYIVNYLCLAIYFVEFVVKLIAKGVAVDEFSCVRDPWAWLDLFVIWTGIFPSRMLLLRRRAVLWIRIFKIIPLVPNIRQAFNISVKAVKRLSGFLILAGLFVWLISVIGLQVYMGTLTQKCIKEMSNDSYHNPSATSRLKFDPWTEYNRNMTNWYKGDWGFAICGNASGARQCPDNYVCLQGFGENPDGGYTNFDNVLWSALSVFRIATEDFTEEIYRQILAANGPWHILYFIAIFFLLTFPMGCIFFAVLGNLYADKFRTNPISYENEMNGAVSSNHESEMTGIRQAMSSFIQNDWSKRILIAIIMIDIMGIVCYIERIEEYPVRYTLLMQVIPYTITILYTGEFILKIFSSGPINYFRSFWNVLDLIILLQCFLEIFLHSGYRLASIRLLKLVQYWPSLKLIFSVYGKTVKILWGWILYTCIMFGFFTFIAPFQIGELEIAQLRWKDNSKNFKDGVVPRWSFIDFFHSFRVIVRMQIGEWIETLWEIFPFFDSSVILYYFAVYFGGGLLISFVLVGVVYSSVDELKLNCYNPVKRKGLHNALQQITSLISSISFFNKNPTNIGTLSTSENCLNKSEIESNSEEDEEVERQVIADNLRNNRFENVTNHWVYKFACVGVILISSFALALENRSNSNGIKIALFGIEIFFTVIFFIIVSFELFSNGLKKSCLNPAWLFGAVIVSENILNLSVYQLSLVESFCIGLFNIRWMRPLLLISRVDILKAPFRGIKYELKLIWETVLGIFFIWLIFDTFAVHWLAGLYYKCIDPPTGKQIALDKTACIAGNHTWENSFFNFDNSGDGFVNMIFLVSRMGWISLINDASDAVEYDMPREVDNSKLWLVYFILFVLSGGLGAIGILISYLINKFQNDQGYKIILTKTQLKFYTETKSKKAAPEQETWIALEDEHVPIPSSSCQRSIYNFITNKKFDAFVMLVIIFDNLCMSLDHFNANSTFEVIIVTIMTVNLMFYVAEMILKLIAWRTHYFHSGWNILDFIIVLLGGFTSIFANTILEMYFISFNLLRTLRLLRVFRFLLAQNLGSQVIKTFVSAVANDKGALKNLLLLQFTVMCAYAVLGMHLFENVKESGGLDDRIHFKTFWSSLSTLTVLLGFPALDGIYNGLSKTDDCSTDEQAERGQACGNKLASLFYLGSYAGITFIVLLNMYAVLISEILSEMDRLKKKECGKTNGVNLQNLTQ